MLAKVLAKDNIGHCEETLVDEAIQLLANFLDCFAALAMTGVGCS
jgi:hypothetical protein